MKRHGMKKTVALALLAALVPVSGWAFGGPGKAQGPPPEALTACEGKKAGDAAEFTNRRGQKVSGICTEVDGRLVALRAGSGKGGGKGMKGCGEERNGAPRLSRMTAALDLTQDQQKKVGAILDAERQKVAPLREKMAQNKAQLRAAVHSGSPEEGAIRSLTGAQADLRAEMLLSRARAWKEIRALLTPAQQARAEQFASLGKGGCGSCGRR